MSLVGPRPERPQFVEKFREEIPRYMMIRKRIEYDIYYIENWSMTLDLKILFLTVFKGFINENAY